MVKKRRITPRPLIKNIAFFGDADVPKNDPVYKNAFEVAKMLAAEGYTIVNGGGPGVMNASTQGAEEAGGETLSVTFKPTDAPGYEGRYVGNITDIEVKTTNYIERMFKLLEHADMFIIFKGGSGTISEFGAAWALAKIYVFLSEKFEKNENFENAILAMVKASQMYKTATFFSSSAVYQEEKGITLEAENLELNSEECRILAQGIAALREERNNNLLFASNLYAGLSALSKRLYYLKDHEEKKKWQIEAKMNYDMGKTYQMRVIAMLNTINQEEFHKESLETLKKLHLKTYYYFSKAEEIWEKMLQDLNDLLDEEIKILKSNLSVVKKNIIKTEVKKFDYNEIKAIQDCEPIIIIPETFSLIVPKSLTYLTKYPPKDGNVKRLKKFRNLTLHGHYSLDKKQELLNIKSAIGRTIRKINVLYDNDDIEVDKYVELLEKYNIRQQMIDGEITNLENSQKKVEKK